MQTLRNVIFCTIPDDFNVCIKIYVVEMVARSSFSAVYFFHSTSRIFSFFSVGIFYVCHYILYFIHAKFFLLLFSFSFLRQFLCHHCDDRSNTRLHTQAFSEISGIITMFYVVRALSPYTEYEFYVIAVNNIGRGPPSIPATTTTGETGKNRCSFTANETKRDILYSTLSVVARPSVAHKACALLANAHRHTWYNIFVFNWFL